jgi:hypothetical protein
MLWIRIWDGKIQIRDEHPGSATLSTTLLFCYSLYAFQPRVFIHLSKFRLKSICIIAITGTVPYIMSVGIPKKV